MALTPEDLLAISQLLDAKLKAELQPIKDEIREIKLNIEHDIKPNIQLLAENYAPAAKRYESAVPQIESMQSDMDIVKKVVAEHSERLQKIS